MRFTVRRPPTGKVSPCGHRPPGGDVACSVDIGVAPASSAGVALEDRLALAVFGGHVPARGASLRRIRGWHLLDPTASLVLQTRGQKPPTATADSPVEPTFLGDVHTGLLDGAASRTSHHPHIKSLDPNHVEPSREVRGGLLDPVFAPIPIAGFQSCNRLFRPTAAVGASLGPGEPLLQHLQSLGLTPTRARYVQQFACRQRGRHGHAAIDAGHASIARAADRGGDVGERDMPAAGPITGNPVGLDTLRHRPRKAKADPTDLGHPHPTKAAIQLFHVMRFHCDLPKTFVHTRLAPRWTAMRTGEEIPHGLREISQRLLLHRLTSGPKPLILGARIRQLGALLHISGRLASRLPILLLLHCQIPHIPRVPAMRQQPLLLLKGGRQPKSRHSRTVTITTDIRRPGVSAPLKTCFLRTTKVRGFEWRSR